MSENFEEVKQKTLFGGLWKFLERILAQAISFIVSLILARILSPNEYGVVSIVIIMINLLNVFVASGYGTALIQKKEAADCEFNTMFTFSGSLSVVLYLVLFFVAPYIAQVYENESLTLLIRIMGLRLPIASFNSIQQAYVAKRMEYRKFFWATLGGTIASGVIGVTMALTGWGIWALVGQYFTNVLINSVILYFLFPWRYKPQFSGKLAWPMIRFGSSVLLANFVDAVYQELRALVVGVKYNAEELAYYSRGDQFPKLFVLNISSAIDGTLLPAFSLMQSEKEKMQHGLQRATQLSTLLVAPLMMGMAAIARPMVLILLTDKWIDAVPYVQAFCVMYMLNPLISTSNQVIKAMGSGGLYLTIEFVKKGIFILLLLLSLPFGPLAIAWSSAVAMFVSCIINALAVKKVIAYSLRKQLASCLPQYLAALIMWLSIWPLGHVIHNVYLLLGAQILLGVIVFIIIMLITRNNALAYMLSILKNSVLKKKTKSMDGGN